jgi:DNA-binding response OmpR family regulator
MSDHTDQTTSNAQTITVMVVDTEILARMVIADYLRECGYRVVEGVTADEVFVTLGAGIKIDIVFADVHLSGNADGFNLARRIRESHPHIDVILTAGTTSAAQKASELCGDGPLDKPYHPQDVISRINILREHRRMAQSPTEQGGGPDDAKSKT